MIVSTPAPARLFASGPDMTRITYDIDDADRLSAVDGDWSAFARDNGAPYLADSVLGRPLWDFIEGDSVCAVYRQLLERVRRGSTVTFPFRCDGPGLTRSLLMTMSPGAQGSVSFTSLELLTEPKYPTALLPPPQLTVCSWCQSIWAGEAWGDADFAQWELALQGRQATLVSHGICDRCALALGASLGS